MDIGYVLNIDNEISPDHVIYTVVTKITLEPKKLILGLLESSQIAKYAVLLVILISTTFAPLGSSRVSNEAKA